MSEQSKLAAQSARIRAELDAWETALAAGVLSEDTALMVGGLFQFIEHKLDNVREFRTAPHDASATETASLLTAG